MPRSWTLLICRESAVILHELKNEPVHEKTNNFGFLTRSDTNQAVQSQNKARSLKLWI